MKLVRKFIEKDKSGAVTLVPEELEDMWHAYNLISKDDQLKASTIRKVVSETATGSTDKSSIRITLELSVETVQFDTSAGVLRVNGRNITENKYVKMGAYHTIDLELNRLFTLKKHEWDIIALNRIDEACDIATKADIAAVVLQEGLANVCLMTQSMTVVRARIETPIPRKRKGSVTNYEKGLTKFHEQVYQAVLRHVDFSVVKVLIIASPGFVKDQLFAYLNAEAIKTDNKAIIENKSKILLVHCSSGHKHALKEVLEQPAIQSRLSDTKYAQEVKTLERFYVTLAQDPDRAYYGFGHVNKAADLGGVEVLMVTDDLFRSADVPTRRKYIDLVERVQAQGGTIQVFSTLHVSGEQLNQLSGVAAILQFPLPDIEDEEGDEQKEHDSFYGDANGGGSAW
ncbi:hypothetical protein SeMB42_g03035 [Synchytrium endobioticum]|uniref:Protein DOM34 homolog n=1 Tax=Synchytrium endobioticum TaxID=286115 RepID=A0A507D8X8_9FUNG|nr:hypothetical protein SeLEV6574_g02351 [Synchytrium endobioticum]TPX48359.1 hypothetical protein SeMB42_g03035 [Synchytrium endobioticum]